jgi:hypothetical protein
MAHAHHHHDDQAAYYLEQLCTIALCGALGGVCVLLWLHTYVWPPPEGQFSMLSLMLDPRFHTAVLFGGLGLLALVAVRAVGVWVESGRAVAHTHDHDHDHAHGHDHGHDHTHCDHDHGAEGHEHTHAHDQVHEGEAHGHDHGHEHGWNPIRYAILLLPVVLYFLNVPSKGLSFDTFKQEIEAGKSVAVKERDNVLDLDFKELKAAASSSSMREYFEGRTGRLKGQYVPSGQEKVFSLIRLKMRCCGADAVPADVVILAPQPVSGLKSMDWVEVQGVIQFNKRANRNEFVPVLQMDKISPTAPEPELYMQ